MEPLSQCADTGGKGKAAAGLSWQTTRCAACCTDRTPFGFSHSAKSVWDLACTLDTATKPYFTST